MRRSHRNSSRLTAKERADSLVIEAPLTPKQLFKLSRDVERLLQAHAKQTLARRGPSPATIKRRFLAQLRAGTWQHTDSMREAIDLAIKT